MSVLLDDMRGFEQNVLLEATSKCLHTTQYNRLEAEIPRVPVQRDFDIKPINLNVSLKTPYSRNDIVGKHRELHTKFLVETTKTSAGPGISGRFYSNYLQILMQHTIYMKVILSHECLCKSLSPPQKLLK
eukprot:g30532.t1